MLRRKKLLHKDHIERTGSREQWHHCCLARLQIELMLLAISHCLTIQSHIDKPGLYNTFAKRIKFKSLHFNGRLAGGILNISSTRSYVQVYSSNFTSRHVPSPSITPNKVPLIFKFQVYLTPIHNTQFSMNYDSSVPLPRKSISHGNSAWPNPLELVTSPRFTTTVTPGARQKTSVKILHPASTAASFPRKEINFSRVHSVANCQT